MITVMVALLIGVLVWGLMFSVSNQTNKFRCVSTHTWLRNERGELQCGFCGYNPSRDED